MGDHAGTHCVPRLRKVIDGEQGGISEAVDWQGGGGFRFYTLGAPVFDPDGPINPAVRFATLAGYLWFLETGVPWPGEGAGGSAAPGATGSHEPAGGRGEGAAPTGQTPLLGIHDETAVVLLYNGILGDRRADGGNVLTSALWREIEPLGRQRGATLGALSARRRGCRRRDGGNWASCSSKFPTTFGCAEGSAMSLILKDYQRRALGTPDTDGALSAFLESAAGRP